MSFSRVCALLFAALIGFVSQTARPAWAANPLDAVDEDDREALEALALYPEETRNQALVVASEPSLLQDLQKLQESSQGAFRDLLNPYAQDDQEQLFELSRYPDLVADIARGGPKSRSDLERMAADYPEDVRKDAVQQGAEHAAVIGRMHALLEDFDGRFNRLIEDLPDEKKDAFRGMLGTPELLSILNEHTRMTVLLGDAYDRDPRGLRDALADLNVEVARRNAEEADNWKQSVDNDPDLRRDYDQAANDYQRDTGYSAYQAPAPVVQVNVNPYPYWFGYPWWYPVSYTYYDPWYWWYPRHYWGGCGYYFGPRVAFYGGPAWAPFYPTFGFTSWYFSFGGHHAHYPYLSDHFVSYYQHPVFVHNHVNYYNVHTRVVKKFVYQTDRVLPASYFKGANRADRVKRFREFGKIAPDIEKVQRETRQREFAKEHGKRPGRDFAINEDAREDKAARDEIQKIVKKNPKNFPELAKIRDEDWKKAPDKGRAKREGLFEGGGKGQRGGEGSPTLGADQGGGGGKGKGGRGEGGGSETRTKGGGQGGGVGGEDARLKGTRQGGGDQGVEGRKKGGGDQGVEGRKKGGGDQGGEGGKKGSGKVSPFGGGQGTGGGQGGGSHGGGGGGGAGKSDRGGDEGTSLRKQGGGQGGSGGQGHGGGQGGSGQGGSGQGGGGGGAGKGDRGGDDGGGHKKSGGQTSVSPFGGGSSGNAGGGGSGKGNRGRERESGQQPQTFQGVERDGGHHSGGGGSGGGGQGGGAGQGGGGSQGGGGRHQNVYEGNGGGGGGGGGHKRSNDDQPRYQEQPRHQEQPQTHIGGGGGGGNQGGGGGGGGGDNHRKKKGQGDDDDDDGGGGHRKR